MSTFWRIVLFIIALLCFIQFSGWLQNDFGLIRMKVQETYTNYSLLSNRTSNEPALGGKFFCHGARIQLRNVRADVHEDTWQTVKNNSYYVYSAFVDPRVRNKTLIRMIGLSRERRDTNTPLFCQIWLPNQTEVYAYPVKLEMMTNTLRSTITFVECAFLCMVPIMTEPLPEGTLISLAESKCGPSANPLRLHVNKETEYFTHKFHACLSGPLKNNYDQVDYTRQWIEVQALYGADRFTVYMNNISDVLQKVLDPYIHSGSLIVHRWSLPLELYNPNNFSSLKQDPTWNLAQAAAVNDCVYRNMYSAEHLVFSDMDELVVPRCPGCKTWAHMMAAIRAQAVCPKETFLGFRNVFFVGADRNRLIRESDQNVSSVVHVLSTHRKNEFSEYHNRAKYIVNPRAVLYTNIHHMYRMFHSVGYALNELCVVNQSIGALHHYKNAKYVKSVHSIGTIDKTTHINADAIMRNLRLAMNGSSTVINRAKSPF